MIQLKPGISASQFNKGRKGRGRARTRRDTGAQRAGLHFKRVFSDGKCAPFDEVEWERRTAEITDDSGKIIFQTGKYRSAEDLERAGDEDRGLKIFLRRHRQRD